MLGLSIRKERPEDKAVGYLKYTARVVVKTNESPYVDGMNIVVIIVGDSVVIYPNCFENTPELQGGTVENSLNWIKELEEISYLQIVNLSENTTKKWAQWQKNWDQIINELSIIHA